MSLETLLEAARYLEYQSEARRRGEVPKDYKTYAALQNNNSPSPPPPSLSTTSTNHSNNSRGPCLPPPPPPPLPPPAPKHNHVYQNHVNGVTSHQVISPPQHSTPSPPRRVSPPPSQPQQQQHPTANTHYAGLAPHDGSYLAARLTAPPPEPVKNHHSNHVSHSGGQLGSHQTPTPHHHHISGSPGGGSNGNGADTSSHELKRRLGAGTREVHNKLEKNRRAHLKECFELLRRQIPSSHDDKKPSNLSVLHSALRYIQTLRRKERDYEHEMERLAREKIACQQRLSALKKELSAQWDHIDFAALLPETPPNPAPAPANSTSAIAASVSATSSAPPSSRGGRSFDSDEDFEFEELEEEEMRRTSQRSDISPQHSASTSTASERGHPSDVEDLTMSSRPGSSRDQYSSSPPPAPSLTRSLPPEQPSPRVGATSLSLAAELARNNTASTLKGEPVSVVKTESKIIDFKVQEPNIMKLEDEAHRVPTEATHSTVGKLQITTAPQLHLSPQLVSATPGIMGATGATLVGPAIQLLTTQSLRMLSATPDPRQTDSTSRLPGGAEINMVSSTVASTGTATLARSPSKPINLSVSGTAGSTVPVATTKLATLSHSIINGGVISHAPAMHRPPLSSGVCLPREGVWQNHSSTHHWGSCAGGNTAGGATVLTTMHGTPTVVGAHHLSSATGITHVVTAGGTAHLSALTPLVAGPVTMVTPGNHHSGVHILATHTSKTPFQVVSGPLLKTHPVLPAQYLSAATTAQLKPVVMVSSPGMPTASTTMAGMQVTRPQEPSGNNGGGP